MRENEFDNLLEQLQLCKKVPADVWRRLLTELDGRQKERLTLTARGIAQSHFGKGVYVRALIEISSYCRNNCNYCGLRCANLLPQRYRLSKEEILECCREAAAFGFNTFVLQGGEDPLQTDEWLADVVRTIKGEFPTKAITLSVGERSADAYTLLRTAGADRYLLRHETANAEHGVCTVRRCLFVIRR